MKAVLGSYVASVDAALKGMDQTKVVSRIWEHDHTVWKPEPTEITNRLGWLGISADMKKNVAGINALVEAVRADGYTHALLLGMGGSSLAPEVMRKTFGVKRGYLDLAVLDSTDPGYVTGYAEALDCAKTLFIVSTKSGGTAETLSCFKFFYNRTAAAVGAASAGAHFVAITDPGSKLEKLAADHSFRKTFLNDPNIGGRYSALSYFGMVPAGLIGADVNQILDRGIAAAAECGATVPASDNVAARIGVAMGELAKQGRDKLTFVTSPQISSFEDWVEQLIAESTGKEGTGVVPIVGEDPSNADVFGDDRVLAYLKLAGDTTHDAAVAALHKAGQPLLQVELADAYDLGRQYLVWELATAVAGAVLAINPFDQPNVESAKVQARAMIAEYQAKGALPAEEPAVRTAAADVYGAATGSDAGAAVKALVEGAPSGGYVSFHAYLTPGDDVTGALQRLRTAVSTKTKLAATIGYGPRFLHSTGQLHKGDGGRGVFVQFTTDHAADVAIPDEPGADASAMTFGVLQAAQALGDRKALEGAGRKVIRVHLKGNTAEGIAAIADAIE